jgi:hypothetical protein
MASRYGSGIESRTPTVRTLFSGSLLYLMWLPIFRMAVDGAHSIGNLRPLLLLWLLDETGRKDRVEPMIGMAHMNESQRCLDLRRVESDPEGGAAVFAVRQVGALIANKGSTYGQPDSVDALHPFESEAFLLRAVETIQKTTTSCLGGI